MGNSLQPTPALKSKHVVIVGFSFAGYTIASMLWDHFRVTVIDRNEYLEHIPSNIKAPIDAEFADRILFPFDKIASAYGGKFTYKQATLVEVGNNNSIDIQLAQGGAQETIKFDFLILCTGSTYANPIKEPNVVTLSQRKADLQEFAHQVDNAKSILVAGAGIVGVEIAGELAVKYGASKSKRIALCLRGDRLLPHLPAKAGAFAEAFLKENNVEILYKTTYEETTAKVGDFDYTINCTGSGSFKTDFMKRNFSQCIGKDGKIYVNDLMQISGVNPRVNPLAPAVKENIFAFGDVCQTSLNEAKSVLPIKFLSEALYKNILEIALGRRPSHQIPSSIPLLSLVSLGPTYGILVINDMVQANHEHGKKKFYFNELQAKIAAGDMSVVAAQTKELKGLQNFLGCVGVCCCCCPCSNCFTPFKKSKARLQ